MFERNVLIVDDNKHVKTLHIPNYVDIAEELRNRVEELNEYHLNFEATTSIDEAIEYLKNGKIVDVLVIDYRFNNEIGQRNGTDLVNFVREKINKHCRVIFYTMNKVDDILPSDLVKLVNNDVYRFIDKGNIEDDEFINIVYKAAVSCDIVITSLEHFWNMYSTILSDSKYSFMGNEMNFSEIIDHIRLDDAMGRTIVEKLFYRALMDEVKF